MSVKKQMIILSSIIIFFLMVAVYQINKIPGEWYGDITIVNTYILDILGGKFPYTFILSAGPLYHYLITPVIYILGISYVSYKIASICVGVLGIIAVYFFAKEISSSSKIGLLTAYITAVSFWFFVFSRLGNSQIVIPVLTALLGYSVIAYKKKKNNWYPILGVLVSSLGLFTYPQTFILPILYYFLILYSFSQNKELKNNWKVLLFILCGFIPAIVFFIFIIHTQPDNFTNGYIGSKILIFHTFSLPELLGKVSYNAYHTAGMLHVVGDIIFRHNVPRTPHLDILSGILFIIGCLYVFVKKRQYFLYIFLPLIILPLPSLSPALPTIDVPSMSRTIGILPFLYLLVSYGLWGVYKIVQRNTYSIIAKIFFIFLLCFITYLNMYKYFILYPKTLPNHNTPFAKIIANYIHTLPKDTEVKFTSYNWGEWGQPEAEAIYYSTGSLTGRENILHSETIHDCKEVTVRRNVIIIFSPNDRNTIEKFQKCFPFSEMTLHTENGENVFSFLNIVQ